MTALPDDTVIIWGEIEVSKEDAEALRRDIALYGEGFLEIFETAPARRIDPEKIRSGEIRISQ